jgi:hypothetical protein
MEDIVMSTLGTFYAPSSTVRIVDRRQQIKYIEHGCYPRDVYVSDGELVMCFDKKATSELYLKWREHEL